MKPPKRPDSPVVVTTSIQRHFAELRDPRVSRLTSVTHPSTSESWSFSYDARGRLVTMGEGAQTVRLRWRGWTLRSERIEQSGASPIERVYRADGIEQGIEHLALVRDVRGSVTGLALDGDRVRTYRYGVWGEQTVVTPGSGLGGYDTHLGFTGHVVHRPTGLVFAPARVYSPRLRQWLTRDPAGERDSVDGRNLYAYVAGDPVNFMDPSGRSPVGLGAAALRGGVALVGGGVGFSLGAGIALATGVYFLLHPEQADDALEGLLGPANRDLPRDGSRAAALPTAISDSRRMSCESDRHHAAHIAHGIGENDNVVPPDIPMNDNGQASPIPVIPHILPADLTRPDVGAGVVERWCDERCKMITGDALGIGREHQVCFYQCLDGLGL